MDACIGVKLHISTLKSAHSVLALSDYSCPWSKAEFPNMDQFQLVSSESDSSYFRHQTIIKILRIRVGGVPVSMNMLPFETLPEELKGTLIPCGLTKYGVLSSLVTKGVETTPSPNLVLWKEEWEDRYETTDSLSLKSAVFSREYWVRIGSFLPILPFFKIWSLVIFKGVVTTPSQLLHYLSQD
ncbi:hypothetical protein C1H46_021411 [Malus baccata]|uniref:Uncharacterized protein n=1 Tax=Malus baccata TaxID=106549 RepID=A0A540M2G6_MALBA|nr:hypothetical protein C1H46_021411 [Malus baccata]